MAYQAHLRGLAWARAGLGLALALTLTLTQAQTPSRNLAPGFTALPRDTKVAVAPLDVEMFELSAGEVLVPKADWTAAAARHMGTALHARAATLGLASQFIDDKVADEHAELLHLHAAVARAISIHHNGTLKLPTKEERLDWSFGDAMKPLRESRPGRCCGSTR